MIVKPYYTVGEVSNRFHISMRTVCKLFDIGKLKGFRLINDRRIYRESIVAYFGDKLGIPCDELRANIVVVGGNELIANHLSEAKQTSRKFTIVSQDDLFSVGWYANKAFMIFLDFSLGRSDCLNAARNYKGNGKLIAVVNEDEDFTSEELKDIGFADVFRKPEINLGKLTKLVTGQHQKQTLAEVQR